MSLNLKNDSERIFPLVFMSIVAMTLVLIYKLAIGDLWASLDANVEEIAIREMVTGSAKIRSRGLNYGDGDLINETSLILVVGEKEEKIEPRELVVSAKKANPWVGLEFDLPAFIVSEGNALYKDISILKDATDLFGSDTKKIYSVLFEGVEKKPDKLIRYYDGKEHSMFFLEPDNRWTLELNKNTILKLSGAYQINLKGQLVHYNELHFKIPTHEKQIQFNLIANNIIFPGVDELYLNGVGRDITSLLDDATLNLIKIGEPQKLSFAQSNLKFAEKAEDKPIRFKIEKTSSQNEVKIKAWGIAGKLTVAEKTLLPNFGEWLYNNFSSISTALLTMILTWMFTSLSRK